MNAINSWFCCSLQRHIPSTSNAAWDTLRSQSDSGPSRWPTTTANSRCTPLNSYSYACGCSLPTTRSCWATRSRRFWRERLSCVPAAGRVKPGCRWMWTGAPMPHECWMKALCDDVCVLFCVSNRFSKLSKLDDHFYLQTIFPQLSIIKYENLPVCPQHRLPWEFDY